MLVNWEEVDVFVEDDGKLEEVDAFLKDDGRLEEVGVYNGNGKLVDVSIEND
ncbi:6017_t:CDS:1, partial [Entrophospora sp. SA101]